MGIEDIKRLNGKIKTLEDELDRMRTQCIYSDDLGNCTINDRSCPFFGCDCSQSYKNGVKEARKREFEGF